MSDSGELVECPNCDEEFELWSKGGFCPNFECGRRHPKATQNDSGGGSGGGGGGSDSGGVSSGSGGGSAGEPSTQSCPGCSADVDADADFCPSCGQDLTQPVGGDDEPTCGSCGAEVQADADFCPSCGSNLSGGGGGDVQPTCDSCGAEVKADTKFCPSCGSDLSGSGGGGGGGGGGQPSVSLVVDGQRVDVTPGELIGGELRSAYVNAGGDMDDARYIHREHVEFDVRDDGVYLIDHGQNTTAVDGQSLNAGDEVKVQDGSTLELPNRITARIDLS
jgi:predicted amidophosphoribosyltransferase